MDVVRNRYLRISRELVAFQTVSKKDGLSESENRKEKKQGLKGGRRCVSSVAERRNVVGRRTLIIESRKEPKPARRAGYEIPRK